MAARILYYIDGPWPTADEKAQGRAMGAAFRNARLADRPEPCDFVAGAVPDCCAHLPRWQPDGEAAAPPAPRSPKRRKRPPPAADEDGAGVTDGADG